MTAIDLYDDAYYHAHCGPEPYLRNDRWLAFFGTIAREIVRSLAPRSVYDAGCAMGMLVESLWDLGVCAHGGDISAYAIANVRPDMVPFCRVASITDPIDGPYDLVTCIEVLEHIPADAAERAIEIITAPTDTVLFSSTPTDFTEPTHVNVRPSIAWINSFARHGFRPDVRYDASFLAPHAMLFRRAESYVAGNVDDLYATHILLRTALVEREQRIGRLDATIAELTLAQRNVVALEAELDTARREAQRDIIALQAELDAARREAQRDIIALQAELNAARREAQRDIRALQAELDATRGLAERDITALQAELDAARRDVVALQAELDATRGLAERVGRSRDRERDDARKRVAAEALTVEEERERARADAGSLRLAEDRYVRALARIEEQSLELQMLRAAVALAPAADEFAAVVRRQAAIEQRYRAVLRADIALFTDEAQRLRSM